MKLENRVCIITGGVRDIGKSISLKLAQEGAKLVINYFSNAEQAQSTLQEVKALGVDAILVQGDMTDAQDVQNLVAKAQEAFGQKIDLLVNVAGGLVQRKTIDEMTPEFFDLVMRLNLTSTFMLTKYVTPHMSKGGSVVNIASQAGRDGGGPGASAYATAKGAVMTFTRAMAKELGPKGIRVNALCPGVISTTFHDTFTKDEVRQNIAAATPLRREGAPDEVGDVVVYLASDEASFLTGLNLDVNGGLLFS
ncbi:3-oxoacyl-ACP reductase FabG [Gilvimarinus agarilyticus]|uniref:SDR family NAD(P)-dependent oxidoreductase n=1 Tax=unclassified Gilvimarinus TaxID=2642066 RepID=UPI001C07FF22|nr:MULTISPECIES: 3-oxoacyl-ACP reductase family protein [unclassified Gilvimarinus]MBU2886520.1 3-oxoacyl-ACP reductase FabG [Gilvimarinus agarilyticus]MDO6571188.1 3-oxoacyl-ACP reductase family protein [Gilvimarinus sp. 2_MG-2023]MDO6746431.1 3-oxoacyl-ACP reductase family protein [Gilvimarinus sp. 1_MG-2023]